MWNAVSSRIWTRVAVSISYEDNNYTTGTSLRITTTPREDDDDNCSYNFTDDDDYI